MPAISVVLATLDRAELLAGTLESLEAQTTALDHEIIVVDRGSTDSTPEVCLPRARAGRLRYRRFARVSRALAKNAGLLAARAPLVLFLDDHVAAPDLLEQHVRSHQTHPEQAVAVQGATRQWSCKRQFLLDHGIFDPAAAATREEAELTSRLAPHGFRVVNVLLAVT
jgi:glycosyltransferase involved in cell wall biosynthesis